MPDVAAGVTTVISHQSRFTHTLEQPCGVVLADRTLTGQHGGRLPPLGWPRAALKYQPSAGGRCDVRVERDSDFRMASRRFHAAEDRDRRVLVSRRHDNGHTVSEIKVTRLTRRAFTVSELWPGTSASHKTVIEVLAQKCDRPATVCRLLLTLWSSHTTRSRDGNGEAFNQQLQIGNGFGVMRSAHGIGRKNGRIFGDPAVEKFVKRGQASLVVVHLKHYPSGRSKGRAKVTGRWRRTGRRPVTSDTTSTPSMLATNASR